MGTRVEDLGNDPEAVLRILASNTVQNLDPVRGVTSCEIPVLGWVYDSLVRTMPDGTLVPGLAESWSSPDPLTFDLALREGVEFQDGEPFDAEAVRQHLERGLNDPESTIVGELDDIESVEVLDTHTVRLHLAEPRAGVLPWVFTGRAGMVPSPTAVDAAGADYGTDNAIGAGPYKYVSHTPDELLEATAWPGYWQPETQLLGGIRHFGRAEQGQVQRVAGGDVDYALVDEHQLPEAEAADSQVDYEVSPTVQFRELFLNWSVAPLDDLRVRQALNHAIDRELLTDTLSEGSGTVAWGPIPSGHWAHNAEVDEMYPYDPAEARRLLEEAGYPDGITLETATIASASWTRMAQALQDMLKESNITLEIEEVPGKEINNELYVRKSYAVAATGYLGATDPGVTLERRYSSTGDSNAAGSGIAELDDLLVEGGKTTDQAQRTEYYQDAEMLVMENALEVPLYHNAGITVFSPQVHNVERGYTKCELGDFLTAPPYIVR